MLETLARWGHMSRDGGNDQGAKCPVARCSQSGGQLKSGGHLSGGANVWTLITPTSVVKLVAVRPLSRRVVDRERIRYPPNRPWPPFPTGDRYFYNLLLDRKPTMMFSSNRLDFTFNKTLKCFGLDVNTLYRSSAVTAEKTPRKKEKNKQFR